jgi:hypothetical protein
MAPSWITQGETVTGLAAGAAAAPFTERVTHGGTTLFRARFSGFSEAEAAQDACTRPLSQTGEGDPRLFLFRLGPSGEKGIPVLAPGPSPSG